MPIPGLATSDRSLGIRRHIGLAALGLSRRRALLQLRVLQSSSGPRDDGGWANAMRPAHQANGMMRFCLASDGDGCHLAVPMVVMVTQQPDSVLRLSLFSQYRWR